MENNALDNFYLQQPEPNRGALLALRSLILQQDKDISAAWKYGMPFFCYKGKMFCYLWLHKKHKQPYIGFVEGSRFTEDYLLQENRSRMKIMLLEAEKDLPVTKIKDLIKKAISFYKSGEIQL